MQFYYHGRENAHAFLNSATGNVISLIHNILKKQKYYIILFLGDALGEYYFK